MNHYAVFAAPDGEKTTVFNVAPDVAEGLIAALREQINIEPPRHATDVADLTQVIVQTSHLIQHLEGLRELAIVAADRTGPHVDRKALGIAAGMPPSRIYRILEKHGQPRRRKDSA